MSKKINHDLFSAHQHALEHQACPQCAQNGRDGELGIRHGKHGPFLGCNQYPQCDYIQPLQHNDGHIIKALGVVCPECEKNSDTDKAQGELLLRQGRYGMFIGCSLYPQCNYLQSIADTQQQESTLEHIQCPECQKGALIERKSRFGKTFYACDAYPQCKFSMNQTPIAGQCCECGFSLLMKKKTAKGEQLICADRKCHYQQPELL